MTFLYNNDRLRITEMFINGRMDKQIVIQPENGISFSAIKKCTIKSSKPWRICKCVLLSERS